MEENALTMRTMTNEELAVLIKKGEKQYLPALYMQVERLLWHSVRRYAARCEDRMRARGVTVEDLIQDTFFALVDAVSAFDPDKGFKFTTYLHFPVKNRLRFALGFTTHRRDPLNDCSSLDAPVGESEEETFLDWYCSDPDSDRPFEEFADNDLWANARRDIDKIMDEDLTEDERAVIICKYFGGDDNSNVRVSEELGMPYSQVRNLESRALMKFRRYRKTLLSPYREEIIGSRPYRTNGVKEFRITGASSVERTVEYFDTIERRIQQHAVEVAEDAAKEAAFLAALPPETLAALQRAREERRAKNNPKGAL